MSSNPAKGFQWVIGAGLESTPGTPVAITKYYEVQGEGLTREPDIQDMTGLTGSRGTSRTSRREGNIPLGGDITMAARQNIIGDWLYWAMGGGNAGAPSLDSGILPTITLLQDKAVRKETWAGNKIDQLELTSETNGALMIHPTLLAMNEVDAVGGVSTPNFDNQIDYPILMHHGLTLLVDGSAIELHSIGTIINNNLDGDHFVNSQYRTVITEGKREIPLTLGLDWDIQTMTTRAVWTKFLSGATAALIATYSDGTRSVILGYPYVRILGVPNSADSPDAVRSDVTAVADDSGPGENDALTISGL